MRRFGFGACAVALGALAASADVTGDTGQLRPETCGLLKTLPLSNQSHHALAFNPNGRTLALAGPRGEVQILRAGSWDTIKRFTALGGHIRDLAFAPDGRHLVVAGDTPEAAVWDLDTEKQTGKLGGHGSLLTSAAISQNGRWFAIAGHDSKVRIVEAGTGREIGALGSHTYGANMLAFTPDSRWLAHLDVRGSLSIVSTEDAKVRARVPADVGSFSAIAVDAASQRIFAGDSTGRIRAFALPDASRVDGEWKLAEGVRISKLAASRDGRHLLACAGHDLFLIDLRRGGAPVRLSHHTGNVFCAEFSPDGRYLASVAADGHLKVWGNRPGGMKGVPPKGFFGIQVHDNEAGRGVVVMSVIAGTAAEKAGVRAGDWVVRVAGVDVRDTAHAIALISSHLAGESVDLVLERDGHEVPLKVTLGRRPAEEIPQTPEEEDDDE